MTEGYRLHANKPNPFNPSTMIGFELPVASPIHVEIFDVAGRRIRTLASGDVYPAGVHALEWDGRNERGRTVASGVYLYRLTAEGFTDTRRMVFMK